MSKGNTAVMVTESLNNENQHTLKYFLQKIRKKTKTRCIFAKSETKRDMENSAEEGETAPAKPAEDEVAHEVVEKDQSAEEVEEEENENKSSIATNNEVASSSKGSIF